MQVIIKTTWIIAIVVVFLSQIWFLLGSTAFFNRGIDLVTTFIYIWVWIPALFFIIISLILLKNGWVPSNIFLQVGFVSIIIIISLIFTRTLIGRVNTEGWLTKDISSDYTQTTSDGKYEYQLQLINVFQKNGCAQLYVKDISKGEEMIFPLNIQTREIDVISEPEENDEEDEILFWRWSKLIPSDTVMTYILTTTKELKDTIEEYEIDIDQRTTRKIK